jgi:hypothetical protein
MKKKAFILLESKFKNKLENYFQKNKKINSYLYYNFTSEETLRRLVKLFECENDKLNFSSSDFTVFKFSIVLNSKKEYIFENDKLFNVDSNVIELTEFLRKNYKLSNFLFSYSEEQSNSIESILSPLNEINYPNTSSSLIKEKKLLGAVKWNSFNEMFSVLNKSTKWVVLRNFETLNEKQFNKGDDIDILCANRDLFLALINAKKRHGGRCSYYVNVGKLSIPLDIRFIGDKYFDPVWSFNILRNRVYSNCIPRPSDYDYFFSLLYHCKLQKKSVKPEYVDRLNILATKLKFIHLDHNFVHNDEISSELLNSFLRKNSYTYTYTDDAVRNENFLRSIKYKEINDSLENWRILIKQTPRILFLKSYKKIKRLLRKKEGPPKVYTL